MITLSGFRKILTMATVVTLLAISYAQAESYEWLQSPEYETIFVYTDFKECDFLADRLNETVKRTFSRSNIETTISSSFVFNTTGESRNAVYELVDETLIGENKIILYIHGKCIRYTSGFVYQFDMNFGVSDTKHSQALLYAAPRHSVIGVDSLSGIDRAFRTLMRNVVADYLFANQAEDATGQYMSER